LRIIAASDRDGSQNEYWSLPTNPSSLNSSLR
jgi:hypothetical protein